MEIGDDIMQKLEHVECVISKEEIKKLDKSRIKRLVMPTVMALDEK